MPLKNYDFGGCPEFLNTDEFAGCAQIFRADWRKPIMVVDLRHASSGNAPGTVRLVRAV